MDEWGVERKERVVPGQFRQGKMWHDSILVEILRITIHLF